MKRILVIGILSGFVFVGCAGKGEKEIVRTSYYHPYGPQISEAEWKAEGCSGETSEVLLSGIEKRREYEGGALHGASSWSFPHSKVIEHTEEYEHGKKVATVYNYMTGSPRLREDYQGDVTYVQAWYEDGTPRFMEEKKDGKVLNGQYFSIDGEREGYLVAGTGMKSNRDDSGLLLDTEKYAGGEIVEKTLYYKNGIKREELAFQDGKRHGVNKKFSDDGSPVVIHQWKEDKLDGKQTIFENGYLARTEMYQNGLKHGVEVRYKTGSNEIAQEISWDRGQKHGCSKSYFIDQTLAEWYWNGNKVSQGQFEQWDKAQMAVQVNP